MSDYLPQKMTDVITYPCPITRKTMLAKEAPGDSINTVSLHVKVMTAN